MRELILIFSYVACAFIPVLVMRRTRSDFTLRMFWATWFISLTGAFSGGLFGTMLIARFGFELGFIGIIIPGLVGAWIFSSLFIRLREMPGNW
jgi:hypothetical protein